MLREVVRRDTYDGADGSWDNLVVRPSPQLRGLVHNYTGWQSSTPGSPLRRHVPSLRVPLILMLDRGFEVNADPLREDLLAVDHAFVAGLHDSYAITRSAGGTDGGVQIDFTPRTARAAFGVPMIEISGRAVEAGDILGTDARILAERIRDLPSWEARFEAIDGFLLERFARATAPDPAVGWAYRQIIMSGGCTNIAALGVSLGWSNRRLVMAFRSEVGLAPKTLARVVRFNRALGFADRHQSTSWADVAAATGYYDQPHLVREFVALSGSPPTELRARTLAPGGGVEA